MIMTEQAGILNTAFGDVQYPVKQYLKERDELFQKKSLLQYMFAMEESTNFAEQYSSETAFDDFTPAGENEAYTDTDFEESYAKVIQDIEWKKQFSIGLKLIEDAKMGKIKKKGNAFLNAFYRTKEKFGAAMFVKGQETSLTFGGKTFDIACADAKALFSKIHPSKTGKTGVQSNLFDVEFSYENLAKVETAMQNFTDDNGNLLGVEPDTIVIPNSAAIKQRVFEILNADGNPTTADRSGNFQAGRWNVVVWGYLGNPSNLTSGKDWWILMDSQYNEVNSAIVWQTRKELATKSYVDENTDANIWKGRARFSAAPVDWRVAAGCIPGSGGTTFV